VLGLILGTASCSRRAAPALTREVLLTFDNLTGDASLDWIAQAAPRMLESDLTGLPKTVPLTATAVREAYLQRATRMVHGYFERRSGKLHFEIEVEDAEAHRMIQTSAEDGEFADAMNRAAKSLDPAASTFPATPAAAAAWGQGQYERAVTLDPDFALAWLAWVEQVAASASPARANEARDIAERALARPTLRSPIDRARLELAAATLRQDDAARIAASRKVVALVPADPSLLGSLAEMEMNARSFADAARDYQAFILADPANVGTRNLLGYAQAFAGDLDGARKSFEEYGRQPGQAVNSMDSLGESLFVNGKFDQAERSFLDAYQKDPSFLQGAPLWKAAHARWLAGDLAGADKLMERYWQDRAKAHDPLLAWRRANWLYEMGRQEQAVELLKMELLKTDAQIPALQEAANVAQRQLQVWNNLQSVPSNLADLEKDYHHSNPASDGLVRTLYAEALLRAGRRAEAAKLVKLWPLPEQTDLLQGLMYPRYIELRKTLQP
jgi:Tfp pilus assembly protein PilF